MNVSKVKTATIMNKFTIQQLQQMRESEDRVEFRTAKEAMFPTMVEARPIRKIVAAASLATSSPFATKEAVGLS